MKQHEFLSLGLRPWLLSLGVHLVAVASLLLLARPRIVDLTLVTMDFAPVQTQAPPVEKQPEDLWQYPTLRRPRIQPPPPKKEPTPPPAPSVGQGDSAVRSIAQVSQIPHFVMQTKPVYPETAKRSNIDGVVLLQVDIDATGKIMNVVVVQSLGFGCDEAAVKALKESTFTPAYEGTEPVPVRITIPYRFKFTD